MSLSKNQTNHVAHLIEQGDWQHAVNYMLGQELTPKDIDEVCRGINFYPSDQFRAYAQQRYAAAQNSKTLGEFFDKL